MNLRFFIAIFVVSVALSGLIYAAVENSAQAVVTVSELIAEGSSRENIRLGARVADEEITYQRTPEFFLSFMVRDIAEVNSPRIEVIYHKAMPDTLKVDRDVILEGDFDGKIFTARSLLTQCPSKYEPPVPGTNDAGIKDKSAIKNNKYRN